MEKSDVFDCLAKKVGGRDGFERADERVGCRVEAVERHDELARGLTDLRVRRVRFVAVARKFAACAHHDVSAAFALVPA